MRYLTRKRANARKEINDAFVNSIYARAKELMPAEYLICHQPQTEEEKTLQLARAAQRRARRATKRL